MCELFAMSSREPAVVTFSLDAFARRGGETGHHRDGWGVAFFEGPDARVLREPVAAAQSPLVRCVKQHAYESNLVISHVRKATVGEISLRNTQPFQRELGARVHVFAHNGNLPGVVTSGDRFRPVGDTDSEIAFCNLLEALSPLWEAGEGPSFEDRLEVVERFAAELRPHGPANFLYSDGDVLFVHGHRRTSADGTFKPPGLHLVTRSCCAEPELDGVDVKSRRAQEVVLIATTPLTDEPWVALGDGELLAVRHGELLARRLAA